MTPGPCSGQARWTPLSFAPGWRRRPTQADPMRIGEQLPTYDATSIQHTVIDADPARVYVVTLEADFVEASRHSTPIRTMFALRAAPAGIARRLRRRPEPPPPGPMRLLDPLRAASGTDRSDRARGRAERSKL